MSDTARQEIFAKIRRSLGQSDTVAKSKRAEIEARIETHRRNTTPARTQGSPVKLRTLFAEKVAAVQGTVTTVDNMDAAPAAVLDYLRQHNLPARIALAPDPTLDAAPWGESKLLEIKRGTPHRDDNVGVTSALTGVAETGTLIALSGPAHPSTLNFLPETHIVILPASRITGSYEDAWDDIRRRHPERLPRTVNMITGPSRSGDIEQTLTLGAHGPRRLHVILVGDA